MGNDMRTPPASSAPLTAKRFSTPTCHCDGVRACAGRRPCLHDGRIGQTSFEQPLQPSTEIIGTFDGFGCFPEKMPAAKNTGDYITDDFEHEIGSPTSSAGNFQSSTPSTRAITRVTRNPMSGR
jgi:hypothetical protein